MKVEMKNIYKSFGSNPVLKDVSISVKEGEIVALLGENGAGKSTLMNILGGVVPKDAGTILLDGKPVEFGTPAQSQEAGIAFIHQELNLINDLPIYQNLFLNREIKSLWGLDLNRMIKETEQIFQKMNIDLDPRTMVRELDASYKQIVEICRAMLMNASIIIMDEPTSSLTEQEIERVFQMMKRMKERGVGIIFISHKLDEVMEICQRYVVLRDGKLVAEGNIKDVTTGDLARLMVGHDVRTESLIREKKIGKELLRVENLSYKNFFQNVHFSVRSGEIVGVTGLLGDGRSELFQTIFGVFRPDSGKIYINGEEKAVHSPGHALELGIGYLPKNRKENGIIKDMNILDNASIASWSAYSKWGIINNKVHKEQFKQQQKTLRIKMVDMKDNINSLSGGNQQKVILARWLSIEPKVLILDNPTQGVDVGAKEDIYDIIMKLAEEGIAVMVLSGEAQEIIRLCDRALVMYHGKIQGEVSGEEMTEENIMVLATGGHLN